jgi:hypothetical protein
MVKKEKIGIEILNAYRSYIDNGYPQDPNVYVIRSNSTTNTFLLNVSKNYQHSSYLTKGDDRFMWFRLEVDERLADDQVIFGPETLEFILE